MLLIPATQGREVTVPRREEALGSAPSRSTGPSPPGSTPHICGKCNGNFLDYWECNLVIETELPWSSSDFKVWPPSCITRTGAWKSHMDTCIVIPYPISHSMSRQILLKCLHCPKVKHRPCLSTGLGGLWACCRYLMEVPGLPSPLVWMAEPSLREEGVLHH